MLTAFSADERVKVRTTSCPEDGKLSLKEDESQFDQTLQDVESQLDKKEEDNERHSGRTL